jgi:hypothetical protein
MIKSFLSITLLILSGYCFSQKTQYKVSIVGFYNLENLYDTLDNPEVNDEEFLPNSPRQYSGHIYWDKIGRLSDVISKMGTEINPDGVALIGVAEVENDTVLTDLVNAEKLKSRNLKICHYDSPDRRGVDVGLLYNPKYFQVLSSAPLFVQLPYGAKDASFTRDVLYVKGLLDGDTAHVFVNHWPSRSGGEERSRPGRFAAAAVVKRQIDSITKVNPSARFIVMGDLNDDPVSPSLTKILGAKSKVSELQGKGIYNPWVDFYKKGIGTSPYQDAWGLFDQILVSGNYLDKEQSGYFLQKAVIFNKDFLIQKSGRWRNYSKRTWDGITYNYGYSDHFPVYLILLKKAG